MFPEDIQALAQAVIAAATTGGLTLATAESCTGGLVAAALTGIPGSSAAVDRGFVTYSNTAKRELLDVPAEMLDQYGAVSEPVARAMAEGARQRAGVDLAVSITGIAGPGGGSADKPVGLVHFGLAASSGVIHAVHRFGDIGRERVRLDSVRVALGLLLDAADVA